MAMSFSGIFSDHFSPLEKVMVSPSWHATWSTNGFIAYRRRPTSDGTNRPLDEPIASAIELQKRPSHGDWAGDVSFACYALYQSVTDLLLRNDPLDAVWRESERALYFPLEAKYGDAADITESQQRFIATMQGRTATFSTFSDAQFDEAAFKPQLTGNRMPLVICWY